MCKQFFTPTRSQSADKQTCSKDCEKALRSKKAREHNLNISDRISKRMRENNPMSHNITREKVSKTLKAIGHKPPIQGGNGRGLTKPQKTLLNELDDTFIAELCVNTKGKNKLPNHIKIDIASVEYMIAIEIDGNSHCTLEIQEQDKRKDDFLCGQGWKVLRLKNNTILTQLQETKSLILSMI